MVILDYLKGARNKWPDKTAFIEDAKFSSKTLTFNELFISSLALGRYLKEQGIKKGMYVNLMIPMSIDLYKTLIALWSIGAIPVFFDYSADEEYKNKCLEIIKPQATIFNSEIIKLVKKNQGIKDAKIINIKNCKYDFAPEIYETKIENQGAIVTFTSGSTGIPKAIVRSHQFLIDQYDVIKRTLHYNSNQIDLGILPIFTLANIATGITTVIPNTSLINMGKLNAKNITKQIETHKINSMTVSPSVLAQIVNYAKENKKDLSSLKTIHVGGGPVYINPLKNIDYIKNAKLYVVYGSSEAEPISILPWEDMLLSKENIKKGLGLPVGTIIPDIDLKIIENDNIFPDKITTNNIEEHIAKVGEIVVAGKNVLSGYYNGVGDEENKIHANNKIWHRTGDCGFIDKNNCLWLVGRKKNYAKKENGDIFYPFQIQCILSTKYKIEKSAFIGEDNGNTLVFELSDKEKTNQIKQEFYKEYHFTNIHFVKEIPMDKRHNSKVDIAKLKELIANIN